MLKGKIALKQLEYDDEWNKRAALIYWTRRLAWHSSDSDPRNHHRFRKQAALVLRGQISACQLLLCEIDGEIIP